MNAALLEISAKYGGDQRGGTHSKTFFDERR